MSTSINSLTHALRVHLADTGSPIVLGHAFQLVVAAMGYTSSGVLQASDEPDYLTSSMHWIVDVAQLRERAASLGVSIAADVLVRALAEASHECGGPRIHVTDADLEDEFIEAAKEEVIDDDDVAAQMADTNTTGPWEVNLEFAGASPLPLKIGDVFLIDYEGQVEGEVDTDRPYSGHAADVTVQVALTAVGRRLIVGPPKVQVVGATLDDGYYGMDKDETPPLLGHLEAIAMELGVSVDEQEQLEGAEVLAATTSANVSNGYLVNIEYCASSPVVDQLRIKHPSQEIWVSGHAIDRTGAFDRD
ncbi:hypothetical protein ABC383_07245 [Noviherbaspirillum sp. 1P10PC]|uniref:hypothetical protein n=1 Tax=Noviherbaspirillum sp. 1P10PC TaxID=3132292 RepID=UPI0039A06098